MEDSRRLIPSMLLGLCLIAGPAACSSTNTMQSGFNSNEYRQALERQQFKEAAAEEGLQKKLTNMTAADHERLGDTYFQQGSFEMSFVQYMHAITDGSADADKNRVRYKIGRLYLKKDVLDRAISIFEDMLKYDTKYALAYEGLGRVYFKKNDMKKAEDNYLLALKLDPGLWAARSALGVIYDRQARFDEAISQYNEAILVQPGSGALFNNLGMAYLYSGKYDQAIKSFSQALKLGGQNPKIFNNMALALYMVGDYKQAMEAFKKAGSGASASNNLGYLFMVRGDIPAAKRYLEEAIENDPSYYVRAHENMKEAIAQTKEGA